MIRSSDFPARATELDLSIDEIAQQVIEAGFDWRKPFYLRVRRVDWATIPRPKLQRLAEAA
jgi:hypothetical protein